LTVNSHQQARVAIVLTAKRFAPRLFFMMAISCGGKSLSASGNQTMDASAPMMDAQGSDDDADASDSSTAVRVPCPSTAPASADSCIEEGMQCEYGVNPNLACNVLATCQGGQWSTAQPSSMGCETDDAGIPACPTGQAGMIEGSICPSLDADCESAGGRCVCTESALEAPPPQGQWTCEDPNLGCALRRAPIGAACTTEGERCSYGTCTIPGGVTEVCTDGSWRVEQVPCGCSMHYQSDDGESPCDNNSNPCCLGVCLPAPKQGLCG
jgi:hypothetical protein